ncbi:SSU ribosomal protein S5P [Hydrogenivirga caldilitoris]|uniref:Small ribosomal subunit protein uS5 n=1 Tax=Hydrogenivirga caldilitoris TaxID=246264 RepID=A0A497XRQ1_9AQUI|nr:30S ribosomal protein S5 [Hydrogenivirga caldilitoris]RLJ69812.1 SSU ribosomal protein S5P [Hydrogenivirga caldilitoris]
MGGKDIDAMIDERRKRYGVADMIEELQLEERLLYANRTARVTKGGRRFSFSTLVIVGDKRGFVGFGHGKAKEVPLAIAKAIEQAKKKIIRVPIIEGTVPHDVVGHFGPTKIIVMPARRGTGVVAGGAAKPIFELAGYTDVLTKIIGSTTPDNVVRAVFDALLQLKTPEQVAEERGLPLEEVQKRFNVYTNPKLRVKLYYPWRGVHG